MSKDIKVTFIRPRVNDMYLWKLKRAYPRETSTMKSNEKIIEYGLQMALVYANIKAEMEEVIEKIE